MLGPRYSDPANRQSNFAVAVGSALSGFSGAQDYKRKKQLEAESDEDRRRQIDRQAQQDAEHDYEAGISTQPTGIAPVPPAGPRPAGSVEQNGITGVAQPGDQGSALDNPAAAAVVTPSAPSSALAGAVGAQLAGTSAGLQQPAPAPNATMPVTQTPPPAAPSGGIRARVGQVLGRIGGDVRDAVTTGGYHGYTPPTYSVTRTGPSAKEREEGVRQAGETGRETSREQNAAGIAAGNNRTAIEVARIGAGSREEVARTKAQQDQRTKLSMQAVASQISETDRAISQLEKEYDRAEPTLVDNQDSKAKKQATQARIQRQMDRLRMQRGNLAQQQQTMMLGLAMGVSDFSGLLPQPTPFNPNDETQMSNADLWEKKRAEGMTPEQATAYVQSRKQGP